MTYSIGIIRAFEDEPQRTVLATADSALAAVSRFLSIAPEAHDLERMEIDDTVVLTIRRTE